MRRINIPEIEDFSVLPAAIRMGMMDFLSAILQLLKIYDPALSIIHILAKNYRINTIIDLASGGGGPLIATESQLRLDGIKMISTDFFPHKAAGVKSRRTFFYPHSVDARMVPRELSGLRTMFSALHHFTEAEIAEIIGDARAARVPFVFADGAGPRYGVHRAQTYLEQNGGAGLQHLALKTDDVFATLREMRARTDQGGFDFMPRASPDYYRRAALWGTAMCWLCVCSPPDAHV